MKEYYHGKREIDTFAAKEYFMNVEEQVNSFHRDGFIKLPDLIGPQELKTLQADTQKIVDSPFEGIEDEIDYFADLDPETGETIFHRVQYIFSKSSTSPNSLVCLLGHPEILTIVHALLGNHFLCEAEALVFKTPGNGRAVPVHADCDPADSRTSDPHLAFNVDVYLDEANTENGCLMVAPGSHQRRESPQQIGEQGFNYPGLEPMPMKAGDVLIHNVRVVHGSHQNNSDQLRRTIYFEFQSIPWMVKEGIRPGYPVNSAWLEDRIRLLLYAIEERKKCSYTTEETSFKCHVSDSFNLEPLRPHKTINLRPKLGYNKFF